MTAGLDQVLAGIEGPSLPKGPSLMVKTGIPRLQDRYSTQRAPVWVRAGEMTAATFSSNTQHEALSLVPGGSEHLWTQAIQVPIPEQNTALWTKHPQIEAQGP